MRFKEWVRKNRNMPIHELWEEATRKIRGYYQHYGLTDNYEMMGKYLYKATRALYKWLNRRSQRKSFDWKKFNLFLNKYPLPKPRIYHNIYEFRFGLEIAL